MSFDLHIYSSGFQPNNRRNFEMKLHRARMDSPGGPEQTGPSYRTACGRTLKTPGNPRQLVEGGAYLELMGLPERRCGRCFPKGISDAD